MRQKYRQTWQCRTAELVAEQHLQQGDAAPIRGEAVADAALDRVADAARAAGPAAPAGGAGHVVFGRVREDGQLLHRVHAIFTPFPINRTYVL